MPRVPTKWILLSQPELNTAQPQLVIVSDLSLYILGCSENIKNHIFYKPDSNYGALILMEKESEEKNSNFKFLAGCLAIWKF